MGRPNRGIGTTGLKRSGGRKKGLGRDKYSYGGFISDNEDYDDTDY